MFRKTLKRAALPKIHPFLVMERVDRVQEGGSGRQSTWWQYRLAILRTFFRIRVGAAQRYQSHWHEFPLLTCIKASSKQVLVLGSVSGNTKDTNPRKHVRTLVTIHFPRHCHVNSTRPGQFPTIPSVGSSNFTKLQNILHAHQQSQDSRLHFSTSSRNGVTKSVADIADLGFGILGNERTKH